MIFDTHAHVLSSDREGFPYSTLRGGVAPPVNPVVFPVEELIRQMDACGIAQACLVQRATLYGYDNRYVLSAAARFADRLAPVVVLDAQEPDSAQKLKRLAAEQRLAGVRLVAPTLTAHDTAWLDSAPAQDFWAAASTLRLPVTVILYRLNNAAGRSALLRVAHRFRELPILVDHVGLPHSSTPEKKWGEAHGHDYSIPAGPDFGVAEHLTELGALPHIHFKVTDINFDRLDEAQLDAARFVRVLADSFGAERLLWGSDVGQSPTPYAEKVARLQQSAQLLNETERSAFFGGTAKRLYGAALGGS
jgi:L-fuconolactonase